ncbi:MAG: T9SS type A sorting domain-containing protein [Flavobacteriales bacterium]|nr:T9SS type A sorting domain-containing protein [Flavobacteriales bacterium]
MKNTFFIITLLTVAITYSFKTNSERCLIEDFQPRSNGAALMGIGDRTGSPISGGATCAACHGGASLNTALSITVSDANGNIVTAYNSGTTYTLRFEVTSNSSNSYGFQGVALTSNNWQAGLMGTPSTSNTQVTNLVSTGGGLQYAEHLGASPTGIFTLPWTAPSSGFGDVTIYGVGLAVNGDGSTSGDNASAAVSIIIPESVSTSITYTQGIYCQNETDPSPTINGTSGGTFSSSTGLSIDVNSGEIDLSLSTPGIYIITYSYSGGTTQYTVVIEPTDNADFSYSSSTYCANLGITTPVVTGLPGGTFTTTSFGLTLDPNTGVVDLLNSSGGPHAITYTTPGPCSNSSTDSITIIVIDNSISANGNVLSANLSGAAYQWLDCDNGFSLINGETNQSYTANTNGNYAVKVTQNGCSSISDCISISNIGVIENTFGQEIIVLPNPTAGELTIELGSMHEIIVAELFSIDGKKVGSYSFNKMSKLNLLIEQPAGYYLISLRASNGNHAQIKVLKN